MTTNQRTQRGKTHQREQYRKVLRRSVSVAAVLAIGAIASTAPASAGGGASWHGVFTETGAGAGAGYDIHGAAKMTIGSGGTSVTVHVAGLNGGSNYSSHLHNGTCASGGGGHYQDVELGAVEPPNELWLTTTGAVLQPNPGGVAHGSGSAAWQARTSSTATNALSVVVHNTDLNLRIACADLQ